MRYSEFAIREMGSRGAASVQSPSAWEWPKLDDPVIPGISADIYSYRDLYLDMGFLAVDIAAGIGGAVPSAGVSLGLAGTAIAAKVAQRAELINKIFKTLTVKGLLPNIKDFVVGIQRIAKMDSSAIARLNISQWGTIGKQALIQTLATMGINLGIDTYRSATGAKDDDEFIKSTLSQKTLTSTNK